MVRACPWRSPLALCLAVWTSGCVTHVVPPATPARPVAVFLLDHGRHSSLVLPAEEGRIVRYSYGDWAYYALGQTGLLKGLSALIGRTEAAMGRRELPGPPQRESVRRQVRVPITDLFQLDVDEGDVVALRARLDALYAESADTRVYSAAMDLYFVRHPVPYTLRHNSNRVVRDWLIELGVDAHGRPLWSLWRVSPE
jgi:hypothetical protein